jgi:hypothetical protein
MESVDHIVCGLPLAWFSPQQQHSILDTSQRRLKRPGSLRQVTYLPRTHLPLYRRYLEDLQANFGLRNVPPASVHVCHQPRQSERGQLTAEQQNDSTEIEQPVVSGECTTSDKTISEVLSK